MIDNKSPFLSNEYDKNINITIPYYADIHFHTIDLINTLNLEKIVWLDIGCGTGVLALKAIEKCNIEKFVFCDISESMLNITKKILKDYCIKKEFYVSSSEELKYNDDFDVVTAIQVHHYLNKEHRIIATQNCYNALKQNGIYISFENLAPLTDKGKEIGLNRWKFFQIKNGKTLEDAQNHISRYNIEYFPITLLEHLEILKMVGFKEVEIFWITYMQIGLYAIK